ncbi:hypothetical protein R1sor_022189 [Riccia sorocarpa]|uniref:Myosin heavy chain n=1 Tax=Riccia sorocarpa TaxID=122646 RepID=A0ABD3GJ60_9MARC
MADVLVTIPPPQDSGKCTRMGVEAVGSELDTFIRDSIFHAFGFCPHEEDLKRKLHKAEESKHDLMVQLQQAQRSLRDCERKLNQSKEETTLNATALKRQIAENQKWREQCGALEDECSRLEQECALYHNDREVFMEAAYEAEDRAAEAEDRATEAENRATEAESSRDRLEAELQLLKRSLPQDNHDTASVNNEEEVPSLKSRIADLEGLNASLHEELARVTPAESLDADSSPAEQFEEIKRQLRCLQDVYATERTARMAEQIVHAMVTSAAIAKALDRAEVAEMNLETCTDNLRKAEDEVAKLADDRRVLIHLAEGNNLLPRILRKTAEEESPMLNKGSSAIGSPKARAKLRSKPCESEESICETCKARQPLMPLQSNSADRKAIRRQYPAVENFIQSPSSPSRDSSPSPKFQDL